MLIVAIQTSAYILLDQLIPPLPTKTYYESPFLFDAFAYVCMTAAAAMAVTVAMCV